MTISKTLHTPFGVARLRKDGYYAIDTYREGNHKKLLHRLIFESFYGFKIPKKFSIHHKDGNKANNCILNLQLMHSKDHAKLHHINQEMSLEHLINKSKAVNKLGIFRVHIAKSNRHKQGFKYVYRFEKNGKVFKIESSSLTVLKEKVLAKDWKWIEFNNNQSKVLV